jgi:thiosulfate dehydrogenase
MLAMKYIVAAAILLAVSPLSLRAADAPDASLQHAVAHGATLFAQDSFSGAGTCETCHSNGGRTEGKLPDGHAIPSLVGAAAGFPRFSKHQQSVITLSQQIDHCITGALNGKPPAPGSADLVDLETYVTSLSKGAVMGKQFY